MLATSRPDDQRPIDDAEEEAFQLSHFSSAEGGALVDVRRLSPEASERMSKE
jgi:hypothetical protein